MEKVFIVVEVMNTATGSVARGVSDLAVGIETAFMVLVVTNSVARVVKGFVLANVVSSIVLTDCVLNEVVRKAMDSVVTDFEVDGATIVVRVVNEVVGVVTGPVGRLVIEFVVEGVVNVMSDLVVGKLLSDPVPA